MAQFARPDSDVSFALLGGHSVNTAGNRYQNIDETPASDSDYVYSQNNPGGTSNAEFGLSNVTDPGVNTGHILRIRTAQIDEDSGSHPRPANTSGTATTCGWELRQGASVIESGSINPAAFATAAINLSSTNVANITDYTDLRVYVSPGGGGGSPANRRAVAISFIELETPDAPVNVDQNDADTGSGADNASLTAADTDTDAGSGADDGSVAVVDADSDSGSGADDETVSASLTDSDSGAGADDASVALSFGADEDATGVDDGSVSASEEGSDAGSGVDDAFVTVSVSDSDAGAGSDGGSVDSGGGGGELPFTGIPARAWPGKFALGHHGDGIEYAPDPTVELAASMAGSSSMQGTLRVVEPVALSAAWEGSAEMSGALSIIQLPAQHPNGSPATPKTPTFRYDGVDITADVEVKLCEFTASSRGNPGTATVRVRNPSIQFVTGKELTCDIGGRRLWGGFVTTVRYGYYFPAAVEQNRFATIQGVDYNVLQQKRVIYDKVTPTKTKLTSFPPGTPDSDVIRYYAKNHTDLPDDDVNLLVGIENVGTPSTDDEIRGHASWTFGELLQMLRFHTGAIDYIDPEKRLIHTDVDTPDAPFGISDNPGAGEIGCRELEIDFGAEAMRNDALMWGAGQGFTEPVFSRSTDDDSVDEHGLWQIGKMIPTIWRQATIDRIADSYVYGSPQNKRGGKDDRVAVRCAVFEPGLRVADKVNVRSEVWGFEDVLPIREMRITFPTPTDPRFDLVLSHEIDDPWSTFEYFFPQIDVDTPDIPEIAISLPPLPGWIDEGTGDPVVGVDPPPSCFDGEYAYLIDVDPDDQYAGWTVAMSSGGYHPPGALADPGHPSGAGQYLLDGDTGTYLFGHRWQTADAIIWAGPTPIYVAYVDIVQGIGGTVKNLSARLRMYVSPNQDGSDGFYVGDTGPVFGESTEGDEAMRVNSDSNVPVRYVRVESAAPAWRQPGVFNVAGNWIVNEARLVGTCVALERLSPDYQIRGGSAPGSPGGIDEIPTPEGEDPDYFYFRIAQSWLPGTLMVWVGGLLIDPSTYEENSVERWIRFASAVTSNIYVRYLSL